MQRNRSWTIPAVGAVILASAIVIIWSQSLSAHHFQRIPLFVQTDSSPIATFVSNPAECRIDPRPVEDFLALQGTPGVTLARILGTPVATASPPVGGAEVSTDVRDSIIDTIVEQYACMRLGDWQRFTALMTDRYFESVFGGVDAQNFAQIAGAPIPQPTGTIEVSDIRALPDGRVSANVSHDGRQTLLIFAQQDERFLIDDMFILADEGTGTPAP